MSLPKYIMIHQGDLVRFSAKDEDPAYKVEDIYTLGSIKVLTMKNVKDENDIKTIHTVEGNN